MTVTAKILGTSKPSAEAYATLYTVGASTQAQAVIYATNQGASADSYRVALVASGGSANPPAAAAFIGYNVAITKGVADKFDGICLNVGDLMAVYSSGGNVSFVATGLEVT